MHLHLSRFDARVHALAQQRRYRPIEGVQGFTRSHWTLPSGEYSGRIASDGQRVRMPLKKYKKVPYLSAVSLALSVRRYVTKRIAQRRGSRAIPEATGRRLRASVAADICNRPVFFRFFWSFFIVGRLKRWLRNNRGMTYQTDRKLLSNLVEHSLRRDNLVNDQITINY